VQALERVCQPIRHRGGMSAGFIATTVTKPGKLDLWVGGRLMLQRLRENLREFSFQVADSTLYTIGYKSLDEAGEKMAADHEAVLALSVALWAAAQTRGRLAHTNGQHSWNVHQPLMFQFGKSEHRAGPTPHAFSAARR
jgi:hypothetical protein